MATDARGGYRRPSRPAPASGPGKLSRRTDGGPGKQPIRALPDAAYGEQATYREAQSAPMSQAPSVPQGSPAPLADLSRVVPFGADSQRPTEPVTSGAEAGPGPGPEALGLDTANDPAMKVLRSWLPLFSASAQLPTSTVGYRQFVRRLRGMS